MVHCELPRTAKVSRSHRCELPYVRKQYRHGHYQGFNKRVDTAWGEHLVRALREIAKDSRIVVFLQIYRWSRCSVKLPHFPFSSMYQVAFPDGSGPGPSPSSPKVLACTTCTTLVSTCLSW